MHTIALDPGFFLVALALALLLMRVRRRWRTRKGLTKPADSCFEAKQ